jgi:hypothetical protein
MAAAQVDQQKVIEYYHLLKKDAEVLDIHADLYETELRKATVETVFELGKTFEAEIEQGDGKMALLRGPTNWGVARTVLRLLEAQYNCIAVWYPQLEEWQVFKSGEKKHYRLTAGAVKILGAAQQLATDEAAGEQMGDTSDPQT